MKSSTYDNNTLYVFSFSTFRIILYVDFLLLLGYEFLGVESDFNLSSSLQIWRAISYDVLFMASCSYLASDLNTKGYTIFSISFGFGYFYIFGRIGACKSSDSNSF